MTATLTKWYEEHGRHAIYAGGKSVELTPQAHTLVLDADAVAKGKQTDLDDKGIAKNAREEKLRARDEMKKKAEDDRMARLYRQHVLGEAKPQEVSGLQIQGLKKPAAKSDDVRAGHHALGRTLRATDSGVVVADADSEPGGPEAVPPGFFLVDSYGSLSTNYLVDGETNRRHARTAGAGGHEGRLEEGERDRARRLRDAARRAGRWPTRP